MRKNRADGIELGSKYFVGTSKNIGLEGIAAARANRHYVFENVVMYSKKRANGMQYVQKLGGLSGLLIEPQDIKVLIKM